MVESNGWQQMQHDLMTDCCDDDDDEMPPSNLMTAEGSGSQMIMSSSSFERPLSFLLWLIPLMILSLL